MFKFSNIKILQLEISNYCNAACPQCPRNFFGGQTIPTLPLKSWTTTEFKKIFTEQLFDQLKQVYFCGTYGDPLTNSHLVDMCKYLKDGNPYIEIGIHTNGGAARPQVFERLALVTDFIAFGIDGLSDTNHIYRRGVKWQKVMENSQTYIDSGGHAIWDFIVFKHNQHQVEQAKQLSHDMGFSQFFVKRTSRFLDRAHNFKDYLNVYNKKDFIDYTISVPTDPKYINEGYQQVQFYKNFNSLKEYAKKTDIVCNAQRIKEIYIGADGMVFPCGWLHDRLYGPEAENHQDHIIIKKLMAEAGGLTATNVFYSPLENIVNGKWFKLLEDSWHNEHRLERCGMMCGSEINLIGQQNQEIDYKE